MTAPEVLLETSDVRARIMTLHPGESTPFHHHSEVTDHMVCLSGNIIIHMQAPDEVHSLAPGEHCMVGIGRIHSVCNQSKDQEARYLLLQGIGRYDFITASE